MKKTMKILSQVSPGTTASFAFNKFANPQIRKLRPQEEEYLNTASKEVININGFSIQTYHWGHGPKQLLLVHGWEGQTANFAEIIHRLSKDEYTIHGFDAPSHGHSSRGKTSIFAFTGLVDHFVKRYQIKYIVSHSYGGAPALLALSRNQSLSIDKFLLFTTFDRFNDTFNDFISKNGLSNGAKERLKKKIERNFNASVESLNVSDMVKEVNVEKAQIFHDKNDKIIPITFAKAVSDHWNNASLEIVEGTGHYRILKTSTVIDKAINFLNE